MPRKPKTRDNGEGSAYKLKDGRYRAEVTVGWQAQPDGSKKRLRRYVYASTPQLAKAARNDLVNDLARNELPASDPLLTDWITYWVEEVVKPKRAIKTYESYRVLIDRWLIPELGNHKLSKLRPEHVEQLHKSMQVGKPWVRSNDKVVPAKPLAPASILQAHAILSRSLTVAMQRGYVKKNIATLVDRPSVSRAVKTGKYLSAAHAQAVLKVCHGREDDARWSVALAEGLRQGEALGLEWRLVELDEGWMKVEQQLQRRRGGGLEIVPYVKSGKSERTIAIPGPLLKILKAHKKRQDWARENVTGWIGSPLGDLVFTDTLGRAMDPRRDWEAWKTILTEAKAPYVNPHGSRHTAASLMLAQGIDVKVVQAILGHSSSTITRDLYQHVSPELARDAASKVAGALWS